MERIKKFEVITLKQIDRMKQITVNDLYESCKKFVEEGKGDKVLISPDDNECNGYHGVFYALTEPTKGDWEAIKNLVGDTNEICYRNIVIVG